jgi:hypothetical protein
MCEVLLGHYQWSHYQPDVFTTSRCHHWIQHEKLPIYMNFYRFSLRKYSKNGIWKRSKERQISVKIPYLTFCFETQSFFWLLPYKHTGKYIDDVKIRLIGKTNRTLEHYLIHKKPSKEILTRMEPSRS